MALRVAYGTYVGNGADDRDITVSPSFAIKAVLIKGDDGTVTTTISFSSMGGNARDLSALSDALVVNRIQSIGTGTFQIGSSDYVNKSGVTFYYFVLGGDDTEIVAGTYTGNNTDDRQITTNFLPEAVWIVGLQNDQTIARFGGISTDLGVSMGGTGSSFANTIQSFNATGFVIGNDGTVNQNTVTFYYLAIKNVSGQSYTNSYTGNGSDNRNITAPNFQPDAVFVKGVSTNGVFRTASHAADRTSDFDASANQADQIQSFISTGFQIGVDSRVNTNATVYYYYTIIDSAHITTTSSSTSSTTTSSSTTTTSSSTTRTTSSSTSSTTSTSSTISSSTTVTPAPSLIHTKRSESIGSTKKRGYTNTKRTEAILTTRKH